MKNYWTYVKYHHFYIPKTVFNVISFESMKTKKVLWNDKTFSKIKCRVNLES